VANFIGEANSLAGEVVRSGGGLIEVKTPIGALMSAGAGGHAPRPGDRLTVSIRPESFRVNDPPADAANVFEGAVHHTVYLGEVAQHQVSLPAGDGSGPDVTVKALDLRPRIVARDTVERARIWVDPEDVVLLTE
jgi:ABC-type Fe3+/spermidine/putrescine transport system ATPase subunit